MRGGARVEGRGIAEGPHANKAGPSESGVTGDQPFM